MQRAKPFRKGPRALGELAPKALSPAAARLGFGQSDIILHWPDIAGERLAQVSEPERLRWPVQPKNAAESGPEPASLILRVEGAFAIEVQHLSQLLIQRINTRLGWRCVGRIVIRQGPVRRRTVGCGKAPQPPEHAMRAAARVTDGIAEGKLRAALNRLGARVLSSSTAAK